MRVLQLIDTLRSGGAETLAVSYANALSKQLDASFICCTRQEGLLKKQLNPDVGYLFLNKNNTMDIFAFLKLRNFVAANKIDLIQAHSSSWFLGLMVSLSLPRVKLVWHDHYGRELSKRKPGVLRPASSFFDGIISVNENLKTWAEKNLYSKNIRYIKNFLAEDSIPGDKVHLKGGEGFKIICVANFRPQKDHLNLLQAFLQVLEKYPNSTLHLFGKEEQNSYSADVRKFIEKNQLEETVFFYGEQENIPAYLKQANLGVLSSASEGLPVSLLEYGREGLPVVCTTVGQCPEVIGKNGELVSPRDPKLLAQALKRYIGNDQDRRKDALAFQETIRNTYGEQNIIPEAIDFFRNIKCEPDKYEG